MMVSRACRRGREEGLLDGKGISLCGDKNVLDLDRGGGCVTL